MARPAGGYRAADGKRIPGTTTIISRFKDSGGLLHWAWNEGMEGRDFRATRDAAADAGTVAHDLIEANILDREHSINLSELPPEILQKAQGAFESFLSWRAQTKVEIIETERTMVSEKYRYGGTLDGVGRVNGDLCLLDWKSSNRIYSDYLIQLAAYRNLWEEAGEEPFCGFHLLRVGKELGDFHHHFWPRAALEPAWEAFTLMRRLYDLDVLLKKSV